MTISVVMANYNGAKYLGETIESVVSQSLNDFEFIIIDDASTDNSKEIINKFYQQYKNKIKPVFNSKNSGQGVSFNIGIEAAKGSIICFIDSDDIWFQNKLKNVLDVFLRNSNIVFHQHNLSILQENKITEKKFRDILITGDYFRHTKKENILPLFAPTSGLSFRKEILEKVLPIPDGFITCADGYLTRTCFCYGEIAADNSCWGAYRIHDENKTFNNPDHNAELFCKNLLFPALNKFYTDHSIDLKFSLQKPKNIKNRLLDISPIKVLDKLIPRRLNSDI